MRNVLRVRSDIDEPATDARLAQSGDALVDIDLAPEARRAKRRALLSLIPPDGRRMVAAYLERGDYEKIMNPYGPVQADLLLERLPAFIREQGGQVVWSVRLGLHGQAVNSNQHTVRLGGHTRHVFREGYVFIWLPDELVVVSAEPDRATKEVILGVRSSVGPAAFLSRWEDYVREHNYLRGQAFFADGRIIEREKAYTWDDILLPERTIRTVRTHVEGFLRHRLRLKALGVKPRRGLILAGPPGTGKTLLGKVLADTLDVSFMWVSPRHVENADSFDAILSVARFVAPAVVFLEDLDLFAEERDSNRWIGLGELMNQLDGAVDNEDIVTIATTNRLEVIERALRNRPGRFDRVVKFEAMGEECRHMMLTRVLSCADIRPEDMDHLVSSTDEYTPAQIQEVANTILILAAQEDNIGEDACCDGQTGHCGQDGRRTTSIDTGRISVTRRLVDDALADVDFERKTRLGFHVA